jgi:hypothetical protein
VIIYILSYKQYVIIYNIIYIYIIGISLAQNPSGEFHIIPNSKFTTLYILNLNLKHPLNLSQPLLNYSYHNGFILPDIIKLSKNKNIQDLSNMVLNHVVSGSSSNKRRVDIERDNQLLSLSISSLTNLHNKHIGKDHILKGIDPDSPKLIHWRDAVKFTRTWAMTFKEETKSLNMNGGKWKHLEDRATAILSSIPGAPLGGFRIPLAKMIKSVGAGISPKHGGVACSASSWVGTGRLIWTDIIAHSGNMITYIVYIYDYLLFYIYSTSKHYI